MTSHTAQFNAKVIMAINSMALFCRLLRYYATNSNLGPKVCVCGEYVCMGMCVCV